MRVLVIAAALASGLAATCPDYSQLREHSVSAESGFSMKKLEGVWNILATSEPTIPKACRQCGVVNFTIYDKDYRYRTTSSCAVPGSNKRVNVTISLGGHLGGQGEPGNCKENFALFNQTVESILMPNMFFNYTDDWYMSYACGRELGVMKVRSFFLGARNGLKSKAWIDEKIEWAKANSLLEGWENIAITDSYTLQQCWGGAKGPSPRWGAIAAGFLEGLLSDGQDGKDCLADAVTALGDDGTSFKDILQGTLKRNLPEVFEGLRKLADGLDEHLKAKKECGASVQDVKGVIAVLRAIHGLTNFTKHIAGDLVTNFKDILTELGASAKAFEGKRYEECGKELGIALHRIVIGKPAEIVV